MSKWQTINTAPEIDVVHIRGLWVRDTITGTHTWDQSLGYVDEFGDFNEASSGDIVTSWAPEDYTHWMPAPKPPKKGRSKDTDNE